MAHILKVLKFTADSLKKIVSILSRKNEKKRSLKTTRWLTNDEWPI